MNVDTSPNLDPAVVVPFVMIMLGMAFVLWIAMIGGSLKLSFVMLSNDSPSYLRCLLAAILLLIVNVCVFLAILATVGPQPWYILAVYQFFAQAIVVSLVAHRNPLESAVATFLHHLFATAGTVAIVLTIVISSGSALDGLRERGSLLFAKAQESIHPHTDAPADNVAVVLTEIAAPVGHSGPSKPTSPDASLPVQVTGANLPAPIQSANGITSNPFIQ